MVEDIIFVFSNRFTDWRKYAQAQVYRRIHPIILLYLVLTASNYDFKYFKRQVLSSSYLSCH